jgi:hypothetical protein
MGCGQSTEGKLSVEQSKKNKKKLVAIVSSVEEWKADWMYFTDAVEKNQICATHWVRVCKD